MDSFYRFKSDGRDTPRQQVKHRVALQPLSLQSDGEIWANTALVQRRMCEYLGEYFVHWSCAVFSHIARKMNYVCISLRDHDRNDCYTLQFKPEQECDINRLIPTYVSR